MNQLHICKLGKQFPALRLKIAHVNHGKITNILGAWQYPFPRMAANALHMLRGRAAWCPGRCSLGVLAILAFGHKWPICQNHPGLFSCESALSEKVFPQLWGQEMHGIMILNMVLKRISIDLPLFRYLCGDLIGVYINKHVIFLAWNPFQRFWPCMASMLATNPQTSWSH